MSKFINQPKLVSTAKFFTVTVTAVAILLSFIFYFLSETSDKKIRTVAITQIIQHPSLDQIRQGIIDQLAAEGFINGKNISITYENAQGNITTASQIAQKFVGVDPSVIVAISTPSAQTVQAAIRDTQMPMVFSAVTDPIAANLVKDYDKPGLYITGTVDLPPLNEQLKLLKRLVPDLRTIGVIYNPGEINSVRQIEKLQAIAQRQGIKIMKSPAVKSTDVYGATIRLVGRVDAIYLPNDNAIVAALDSIVRVTTKEKIPTLASEDQSVERGVLVGLANNQYEVGRDTGTVVAKILRGEKPGDIPVYLSHAPKLTFNEEVAKKLGVDISGLEKGGG